MKVNGLILFFRSKRVSGSKGFIHFSPAKRKLLLFTEDLDLSLDTQNTGTHKVNTTLGICCGPLDICSAALKIYTDSNQIAGYSWRNNWDVLND